MKHPEDLIPYLRRKRKHWKRGYSAYELAHAWYKSAHHKTYGFPDAVSKVLDKEQSLSDLKLIDGFFERKTALRIPPRAPSQTDLLVFAKNCHGRVLIGVEGKAKEPFGQPVGRWLKDTRGNPSNRESRLLSLCETLGIGTLGIDKLRYQLFHRTAAVVYEARDCGITRAVILVHSFNPSNAGFDDFRQFAEKIGTYGAAVDCVSQPVVLEGVTTYLGWVSDKPI